MLSRTHLKKQGLWGVFFGLRFTVDGLRLTVNSLQKNKPHKAQIGEGKREMGEK